MKLERIRTEREGAGTVAAWALAACTGAYALSAAGEVPDPLIAHDFCQVSPADGSTDLAAALRAYTEGSPREAIARLRALPVTGSSGPTGPDRLRALNGLARAYKAVGCLDDAILTQQRLLQIAEQAGDERAACAARSRMAHLVFSRDSAHAEDLASEAAQCARQGRDGDTLAEALATVANRRLGQSQFEQTERLLDEALAAAPAPLTRADLLRIRAVLRSERRPTDLEGAAQDLEQSVASALLAGDPEAVALGRLYLIDVRARALPAGAEGKAGRRAAREQSAAIEASARASGLRPTLALAVSLAAQRYKDAEKFGKALDAMQLARDLYLAMGNTARAHSIALDLATLHWQLGRDHFDQAADAAQVARRISQDAGYALEAAKADHLLALIALEQGDRVRARALLNAYLQSAMDAGVADEVARVRNDLARVDLLDGHSQDAIVRLESALQTARAAQDADLAAAVETTLGWALDREGRSDAARSAFLRAIAEAPERGGGLRRVAAYWGLARAESPRRAEVAIAYYKMAVQDLEGVVSKASVGDVRGFEAFRQRYSQMYRELAALLVTEAHPFEAQHITELMQLQELREGQWAPTRASGGPVVALSAQERQMAACQDARLEKFKALVPRIDAAQRAAAGECPDTDTSEVCTQRHEIAAAQTRFDQEGEDCIELSLKALPASGTSDAEEVVRAAFQGAWQKAAANQPVTLIVTLVHDDHLDVLLSREPFEGFVWNTQRIARPELEVLVRQVREAMLKGGQSNGHGGERAQFAADAERLRNGPLRRLYEILLAPFGRDALRASGDGTPVLAFALDGLLREVPMAALYDGERYLVDDFATAIVTPRTIAGAGAGGLPRQALVMGVSKGDPPLQNVVAEVQGVASRVHQPSYLDEDATYSRLSQWLSELREPALALHLASHAVLGGTAVSTKIQLWKDDALDGSELRHMQRELGRVRLVTFSACETAGSLDSVSFGLAGIAETGARSVVGSLWSVSDESTAKLMTEFYRDLTEKGSVGASEALRSAQLKVRADFEHPYFWAPFIVVGRWD